MPCNDCGMEYWEHPRRPVLPGEESWDGDGPLEAISYCPVNPGPRTQEWLRASPTDEAPNE